jgi:hypothetical protein
MAKLRTSEFVGEVTVTDPDTQADVTLEVYKHENGGMFAVDSSFLAQEFEEDETPVLPDPFGKINDTVELITIEVSDEPFLE